MADHKTIVLGYPQFPEELRKYLPEGYTMLNVDKKCVCHKCAPGLWAYRFGKADQEQDGSGDTSQSAGKSGPSSSKSLKRKRQSKKDSKVSRPKLTDIPSDLNQIRRSCDYRVPVALFETHMKQLCRRLTKKQSGYLQSFDEAYAQFRQARDAQDVKLLPKPRSLCEPLAELFFDGCLASIGYSWSDQSSSSATRMEQYNTGSTLYNEIGLPRIIKLNSTTCIGSDMEDSDIVSTILHEMVHAFLGSYICNGSPCLSNRIGSRKIALCRYMNARSVKMFYTVTIGSNEDMKVVDNDRYYGHGPIFQHLLRSIHDHAAQVIGFDLLPKGSISEKFCKCFKRSPSCFFHCCDGYEHMQQEVLKDLKQSGEEDGEEEEGEEEEEGKEEGEEDEGEDEEGEDETEDEEGEEDESEDEEEGETL